MFKTNKMKTNYPRMHASFYVKDLEKTIQFYTEFFGQDPDKIEHRYTKFTLDEPSLIISFIENPQKVSSNFGHLGFQVDSVEELKSRLDKANAKNLVKLEEKGTSCCYAIQDKFWVTDPDGIQWEVYYFHSDSKFNDPRYSFGEKDSKDESACCTTEETSKEIQNCC